MSDILTSPPYQFQLRYAIGHQASSPRIATVVVRATIPPSSPSPPPPVPPGRPVVVGWHPQLRQPQQINEGGLEGEVELFQPTYGILGSFRVGHQLWLATVQEVRVVGTMLSHYRIYSPTRVNFYEVGQFSDPSPEDCNLIETEGELEHHRDLLENGGFYFSYHYPLWNHLQFTSQSQQLPSHPIDLVRRRRYIWNHHLLGEPLPDSPDFLVKLIRGYVEIGVVSGLELVNLTRIDQRNAGTRFTVRGLTEAGAPANSVESELILASKQAVASHLQYRGSLPLLWSQHTNHLAYKPPVSIINLNGRVVDRAILTHFQDIMATILPGKIHLLNLLRACGDEHRLSKSLEVKLGQLPIRDLIYHPLPLGWGSESLTEVMDLIHSDIEVSGYFLAERDGDGWVASIRRVQGGLFRTNCMDCCDRTSITQFGIIFRLFPELVREVSSLSCDSNFDAPIHPIDELDPLILHLRHGWARMANSVAFYYTGTGIVNETIIRDGANCQGYGWKDQIICSTRYFLNNTHDLTKKVWLDRFQSLSLTWSPSPPTPKDPFATDGLPLWRSLLGPPPSYASPFLSTTSIEHLSEADLVALKTRALADIVNLSTLHEYCRTHGIDIDHFLAALATTAVPPYLPPVDGPSPTIHPY